MAPTLASVRPKRAAAWPLALIAAMLAPPARAAEEDGAATMQCDRAAEPGRVRCAVELRPREGLTIRHGEVVIVRSPDFAQPLKGRIGPEDAVAKDALVWRWALALLARKNGRGDVLAEVHVVLCPRERMEGCVPRTFAVKAEVVVGPP